MASKSPDNQTSDWDAAGRSDDGVEPVTPEIGSFEWEELAPHGGDDVDEPRRAQPARVKVGRTARSNRGPLMVGAVAAIATGGAVWGALLTDAVALGSVIQQAFAEEFAFVIDDAIIRGSGNGQPLGILNSGAFVSVTKETNQVADTIYFENIIKMWNRLWSRSRPNAAWYVHQDTLPQLQTMAQVVGVGGVPVYLPASGAAGAPYSTLMGRPVIEIEQADTVGDQGDIMLLDLSQYLMIDKGGLEAAQSIHVRFLYGENTFRFILRTDGQPIWNSPLTLFNSSTTVSPFVLLDARA